MEAVLKIQKNQYSRIWDYISMKALKSDVFKTSQLNDLRNVMDAVISKSNALADINTDQELNNKEILYEFNSLTDFYDSVDYTYYLLSTIHSKATKISDFSSNEKSIIEYFQLSISEEVSLNLYMK